MRWMRWRAPAQGKRWYKRVPATTASCTTSRNCTNWLKTTALTLRSPGNAGRYARSSRSRATRASTLALGACPPPPPAPGPSPPSASSGGASAESLADVARHVIHRMSIPRFFN